MSVCRAHLSALVVGSVACSENKVCSPLLSVYRALLSVRGALLSVYRALLSVYGALFSVCGALLSVCSPLLSVCRALLSAYNTHRVHTIHINTYAVRIMYVALF